jgi:hypothetical protein
MKGEEEMKLGKMLTIMLLCVILIGGCIEYRPPSVDVSKQIDIPIDNQGI